MHMQLHIKQCVLNYGPVYAYWCFPFERFNGVLGSFQSKWASPELQMLRKFLTYQGILHSDISSSLPSELCEFFHRQLGTQGEVYISEGSVEQSHVDASYLLEFKRNATCIPSQINAEESVQLTVLRRCQKYFSHSQVSWLSEIYRILYTTEELGRVPTCMLHE